MLKLPYMYTHIFLFLIIHSLTSIDITSGMSNVINTVPFSGSSTRPGALICNISTGNDRLYFPGLHKTLKSSFLTYYI